MVAAADDSPKRSRGGRQARGEGAGAEGDKLPGIDHLLEDLEQVVDELEAGELPLEKALERFEVGIRLAREGSKLLDAVEERVEILLDDRDEPALFAEGGEEANEDDDGV